MPAGPGQHRRSPARARSAPQTRLQRRRRGSHPARKLHPLSARGVEVTRLPRAHLNFIAGEISRVLTPHPGPLPFEGRGGATVILEYRTSFAAFGQYVSEPCPEAARPVEPTTKRVRRDSLSPQRGEGRGEG